MPRFLPYATDVAKTDSIETLRLSRLNERKRQPRRHLRSYLVMQRLGSEATICPDTMMHQVRQRAAMLFFPCSSNHKATNRYVLYVKHMLIT